MYGSEAGFLAYHQARGRGDAAGAIDDIPAALLVASEWIDSTFRSRFMGNKTGMSTQTDEWPRTGVIDCYGYAVRSDVVPVQIENATYEAALRVNQLNPDSPVNRYKRVKIDGAIEVDFGDTSGGLQAAFPAVGAALSSLWCDWRSGGSSAVSGRTFRA